MRKRNLIIAAVVAWGAILLAAAYVSYRDDPATVPEQTTVSQARATMDRVTSEIVIIAPGLQPAIGDTGERDCEITKARDGRAVSKRITFTTAAGAEKDLLRTIAQKLAPGYQAEISEATDATSFYADAGNFVAVRGRTEPGTVTITMTSGCRVAE